jgi:hypothetical protein
MRIVKDYNEYVMRNLARGYTRKDLGVSYVKACDISISGLAAFPTYKKYIVYSATLFYVLVNWHLHIFRKNDWGLTWDWKTWVTKWSNIKKK